jgi:protocatechuate 4,5-dioxygenase alpha chain
MDVREISGDGTAKVEALPDVPMLDRAHQRIGRPLNRMAMSLNSAANRALFKRDELRYIDRFGLTPEQCRAVVNRDWREMLRLGGNLFCVLKITSVDPYPMTRIGADQRGMDHEAFVRDVLGKR